MKIGVTYNPYTKENERIIFDLSDEIDFIEIKNLEFGLLRSKVNILDKFPLLVSVETKEIIGDKNSDLYKAFDFLNPFVVSFHLGFSSKLVGTEGIDNHNYAIGEVLSEKEIFKSITDSLQIISEILREKGYKGKILIENLDYHPTGAYEYICKPDFISKVAKNTNCGVLLDLAHTIISAHSFGMDMIDFVEKIDVNLIYEIHVNSPLYKNGKWYDINEPFYYSEEAKRMLEHIIKGEKAKFLNIECDKDIVEQINRCEKI
jgi:uncharacterized protein (UPF0276 family)